MAPDDRPENICALGHPAARRFGFAVGATWVEKCPRHAVLHRPLLRNSIATVIVVRTVLTAINQGNVLLHGLFPAELRWKIPLTYAVPYCVSTWGALRISRVQRRPAASQ